MRFRFRGSYSCGEQSECSASQGRVLLHLIRPFEFKIDDTMLHEEV